MHCAFCSVTIGNDISLCIYSVDVCAYNESIRRDDDRRRHENFWKQNLSGNNGSAWRKASVESLSIQISYNENIIIEKSILAVVHFWKSSETFFFYPFSMKIENWKTGK